MSLLVWQSSKDLGHGVVVLEALEELDRMGNLVLRAALVNLNRKY
jgi:hypothetical protein